MLVLHTTDSLNIEKTCLSVISSPFECLEVALILLQPVCKLQDCLERQAYHFGTQGNVKDGCTDFAQSYHHHLLDSVDQVTGYSGPFPFCLGTSHYRSPGIAKTKYPLKRECF